MDKTLKVSVKRTINAPVADVFKAWVDPEIMKQWYSPAGMSTTKTKSDPTVGGKYEVTMAMGDQEFNNSGKYLEIDEPNKLVFTWNKDDSIVTVLFTEVEDGKTEVSLTHTGFADEASQKQHEQGWIGCLESLQAQYQ